MALDGHSALAGPVTPGDGKGGRPNSYISLTTTTADDLVILVVYAKYDGGPASPPGTAVFSFDSDLTWNTLSTISHYDPAIGDYGQLTCLEVYYATFVSATTRNIGVYFTSTGAGADPLFANLIAFGVSGWDEIQPFDSNGALPGTNTTGAAGHVSVTTSNANDMLIGFYGFNGAASPTEGAGWTKIEGANSMLAELKIVSVTQSGTDVPIGTGNGSEVIGWSHAVRASSFSVQQAAGTGVARAFTNTVVKTLPQAAGTGVARTISAPKVAAAPTGGAGTGIARAFTSCTIVVTLPQAAGVATVGGAVPTTTVALPGVAGAGVARDIAPSIFSVTVAQAAGIGGAGNIRPVLSGGGGTRHKKRGGFEPVVKHQRKLEKPEQPKVWTPPAEYVRSSPITPRLPAPDIVDPEIVPTGLLDIIDQMQIAEDISDINRFLAQLEQDERDIADVLALLAILD